MFFNNQHKHDARQHAKHFTTEQLEPKAMFSVSPVEPVVALDVGPVNQASVEDRMVIEPVFNVGEDSLMGSLSQFSTLVKMVAMSITRSTKLPPQSISVHPQKLY